MKKCIVLILGFLLPFCGIAQELKTLYVVDSIPLIDVEESYFKDLTENLIDHIVVVKDKNKIESIGYDVEVDNIVYVFTKEYKNRTDSIKKIPTSALMKKVDGKWYLKNNSKPYTGVFIDYFITGIKAGQGEFFNGKISGRRILYHKNGQISSDVEYTNGLPNGLEQKFNSDGILIQKGVFKNGKEIGIWEKYHPNGQLQQKSTFDQNGNLDGETISFYSSGKLKMKSQYKTGIYIKDKINDKLFELYNTAQEQYKLGNFKDAINNLEKLLKLNSEFVDGYFARGTMFLNDMQFDKAIADFDKAIEIEPLFMKAYSNRAFVLIRKSEFADSRILSKTQDVKIFASKESEIPKESLIIICNDLNKAISLGDDAEMVIAAKEKYCK